MSRLVMRGGALWRTLIVIVLLAVAGAVAWG